MTTVFCPQAYFKRHFLWPVLVDWFADKVKEDDFRGARLRKSYIIQIALFTLLVLSIFVATVYNALRLNTA